MSSPSSSARARRRRGCPADRAAGRRSRARREYPPSGRRGAWCVRPREWRAKRRVRAPPADTARQLADRPRSRSGRPPHPARRGLRAPCPGPNRAARSTTSRSAEAAPCAPRPILFVMRSYDVVVVGAGILGLAVSRELLKRFPKLKLAVLDKEPNIGLHQSGHNSGVLHSGIYYAPGSLKARLCVEGQRELYAYCEAKGIPTDRCGKVIVASSEDEVPRLESLLERGTTNGVEGLEDDRTGAAQGDRAALRRGQSPVVAEHGHRRLQPCQSRVRRRRRGQRRRDLARLRRDPLRGPRRNGGPAYDGRRGGRAPRRRLRRAALRSRGSADRGAARPAHRAVPRRLLDPATGPTRAGAQPDLPRAGPLVPLPRGPLHAPYGGWLGVARAERRAGVRPRRLRTSGPPSA